MFKLHLIAEMKGAANEADAQRLLDAFRESVIPSSGYGITLYRPRPEDLPMVLVEVSGGVAEVTSKGECIVEIIDYDNTPNAEPSDQWNNWGASAADSDSLAGGHCPDEGCPGVIESDGYCSHCGSDHQDE